MPSRLIASQPSKAMAPVALSIITLTRPVAMAVARRSTASRTSFARSWIVCLGFNLVSHATVASSHIQLAHIGESVVHLRLITPVGDRRRFHLGLGLEVHSAPSLSRRLHLGRVVEIEEGGA